MKYILFFTTLAVMIWVSFLAYEWRVVTHANFLDLEKENTYLKRQLLLTKEMLKDIEYRNFNETYNKGK